MSPPPVQSTLLIIGGDSSFNYLIQRYAEQLDCSTLIQPVSVAADEICKLQPLAVIFSSRENLEDCQALVLALANCDIPLVVCSSLVDQARMRELGADYCLLHPFGYDNFSAILTTITSQRLHQDDGQGRI